MVKTYNWISAIFSSLFSPLSPEPNYSNNFALGFNYSLSEDIPVGYPYLPFFVHCKRAHVCPRVCVLYIREKTYICTLKLFSRNSISISRLSDAQILEAYALYAVQAPSKPSFSVGACEIFPKTLVATL